MIIQKDVYVPSLKLWLTRLPGHRSYRSVLTSWNLPQIQQQLCFQSLGVGLVYKIWGEVLLSQTLLYRVYS